MVARRHWPGLKKIKLLMLILVTAFFIMAQSPTPSSQDLLITAVEEKARQDAELGKAPEGVVGLDLLFGEEAEELGISLREIESVYIQEYKAAQPPPNPWDEIPGLTAILVMIVLAVIVLFANRLAVKIFDLILAPFRFIGDKTYRWIAPRNPLSLSLRTYRKHVLRSALARIENTVGPPIQIPLENAFAPLKLISSEINEGVDLFKHATENTSFMLLGGPGTGKTTLMKSLLVNILNKTDTTRTLNELTPIFVQLRRLAVEQHTVEQAIVAAFNDYHFPGADRFVESAISQGKLLVILDGLDEVGMNRNFVAAKIRQFCEKNDQLEKENKVFVTCRESSYIKKDLGDVIPMEVRVEPFTNQHIRRFLSGWPLYKGKSAVGLYYLIQADPQIRDICRNPLLLTILTGLYLESTDFKIPSSRENFYKEAIDELMIHRPTRKEIVQKYDVDKKRRMLEKVALERFRSSSPKENPEEIRIGLIENHSKQLLDEKDKVENLIAEIVRIDGMLKPVDEEHYTLAHRTIQEYLAAREASRSLQTKEVIEHFGRDDLIEVLYFYCGLVKNIHELTKILNHFIARGDWLKAGHCLINMTETPEGEIIHTICKGLYEQINATDNFHLELEILASLSQLKAGGFDAAREYFALSIDTLTQNITEQGASKLESVLSTKPEYALKVIPALLENGSPLIRNTAFKILQNLGTNESLEQLVELFMKSKGEARLEIAKKLASLFPHAKNELRKQAIHFPDPEDSTLWPLEEELPGNIAIAIASVLSEHDEKTGIKAFDYTARAIREKKLGNKKSKFLRQWKNVIRDHKVFQFRVSFGNILNRAALIVSIPLILAPILITIYADVYKKIVIFEYWPVNVKIADSEIIRILENEASLPVETVKELYPPESEGWARILPWNWFDGPTIPQNMESGYSLFKAIISQKWNPFEISDADIESIGQFESVINVESVKQLLSQIRLEFQQPTSPFSFMFGINYSQDKYFIFFVLIYQFVDVVNDNRKKRGENIYIGALDQWEDYRRKLYSLDDGITGRLRAYEKSILRGSSLSSSSSLLEESFSLSGSLFLGSIAVAVLIFTLVAIHQVLGYLLILAIPLILFGIGYGLSNLKFGINPYVDAIREIENPLLSYSRFVIESIGR